MTFLALPGPTQLWIIALIILLLFGASRLPGLARALGSSVSSFKKGLKEGGSDDEPAADPHARLDAGRTPAAPARSETASVHERDRA